MTWDLLFEAMHAALMAQERVSGTTLAEVAKVTAAAWHDPDAPDWSADLIMEGLARRVAEGHATGGACLAPSAGPAACFRRTEGGRHPDQRSGLLGDR